MKHGVRRTLVWLGAGVVGQRLLLLVAFVLVGRTLGVTGVGIYAQGLALAAVLAALAGAGVRNVVARGVARAPDAARALVLRAVRLRLFAGLALAAVAGAIAFATTERPWFWLWCALHVVPAAFDLKNLLDAAGRTRGEVTLETGAALLQVALVAGWAGLGGEQLEPLAAIGLVSRSVYALGAGFAIARLPAGPIPARLPLGFGLTGLGQLAHELLAIGDVAVVALACGDRPAGYYAVAARIAAAALVPSAQLARLLLPHLLHAPGRGDARRALSTALAATLWLTLPMLAGGAVVADALCALTGDVFRASGDALRLLLLAGLCQHVGWQCSHALLAAGRDRAYAHGLAWPTALAALSVLAVPHLGVDEPAALATAAALAVLLAEAVYAAAGLAATHRDRAAVAGAGLTGPFAAACATAAAAALPGLWLAPAPALPIQLIAGALAFGLVLWRCELRGRLGRVGDGLATASGLFDRG